jgi:hypothetical protein
MPNEIKRLNYYDQQFLREPDFTEEQEYHKDMRRRLNRSLHTTGVVEGLVVSKKNNQEITISAGMALDSAGREIIFGEAQDETIDVTVNGTKFVTIKYTEEQTDPPPSDYRISEADRTRWTESSLIEILNTIPSDPGEQIILAELSIDNNIIEKISDGTPPNHRRVTGERSVLEYVDKAVVRVNERIFQDRRQFVPLLAFSLKGVEYRDGRNATIAANGQPKWLTFDGTHIWFSNANNSDFFLSKINVITNEIEQNLIEIDGQPGGMVFDGMYMWITIPAINQIIKVDVINNFIVLRINIETNQNAIAFDGNYIWVGSGVTIEKINSKTNEVEPNPISIPVKISVSSIVFDGVHMWVSLQTKFVYKINVNNDQVEVPPIQIGGGDPRSLAFDGAHVWVNVIGLSGPPSVFKIDVSNDSVQRAIDLDNNPNAIAFDGRNIWVTHDKNSPSSLNKIDVISNEIVAHIEKDRPYEIVFDGTHIWVPDKNYISKILI